jgi:hypothetical protein
MDVTTADAAIAAADLCLLLHYVEGYTWAPFAQKLFTVGFWVKDTITGVHCLAARNAGSDRTVAMEYTVNAADTWEYKTVTFPASPSAGTWDYTTGIGIWLAFLLAAGSDWQAAAGTWQAGNGFATSSIVNSVSSTSNNFKLWGVTMGLGTTVAPFWPRSFGEELALCQRYCVVLGQLSNFEFLPAAGYCTSTTTADYMLAYPVEMRATPTATYAGPTDFDVVSAGTTIQTTALATSVLQNSTRKVTGVKATVAAGLTTGQGALLRTRNGGTALITISADL